MSQTNTLKAIFCYNQTGESLVRGLCGIVKSVSIGYFKIYDLANVYHLHHNGYLKKQIFH